MRFTSKYSKIARISLFQHPGPPIESLIMCLFAAFLFSTKTIKSPATIKSYIRHAKNYCIKRGCVPSSLESHLLSSIVNGITKKRPKISDTRPAFLLPHLKFPLKFRHPTTSDNCVLMAALIFGFFGMLRFHVFRKLKWNSLVLVGIDGREHKMEKFRNKGFNKHLSSGKIMGFYFDVSDKFHPVSRVYLPKLADLDPFWAAICPFRALRRLWAHELFVSDPFAKENLTVAGLIEAMKITEINNKSYKTHSLRIGGHTFFVTYGMPEDFVNFLGRRKVSKTSQLYYRASARLTLQKFRRFAQNTKALKV